MATVFLENLKGDVAEFARGFLHRHAPDLVRPGQKVLIKPNVHTTHHHESGSTTNPAVVVGAIRFAKDQGASEIVVGESGNYGLDDPRSIFTQTGMGTAVEAEDVRWVVFDEHPFDLIPFDAPGLTEVGLTRFLAWADTVVSVPIMKTHFCCMITGALKNMKGCIRRQDKAAFHKDSDVSRAVAALAGRARADFSLIDGTIAMEGMGPHAGDPVPMGLLMGSADPVAADVTMCRLMRINPDCVLTIRVAAENGIGENRSERIAVIGAAVADMARRFKRPFEALSESMPGVRIECGSACSGCTLNLLQVLNEEKAGLVDASATFVLGERAPDIEEAIAVGKCARDKSADRVPGCPPAVERIRKRVIQLTRGGGE